MKTLLKTILLVTCLVIVVETNAQESETSLRKFGLGLHVEQFRLQDLMADDFMPVNKLILTFSPTNNFRIEPSIGYSRAKQEDLTDGFTYSSTQSGIYIGVGLIGMYQAGSTNLYFGLRTEHGTIKDNTSYSGPGFSDSNESKNTRFMIGPVIGAEYFFGKHFSFGGEFALKNYSMKDKSENAPSSASNKNRFFTTETGLLLRFYF